MMIDQEVKYCMDCGSFLPQDKICDVCISEGIRPKPPKIENECVPKMMEDKPRNDFMLKRDRRHIDIMPNIDELVSVLSLIIGVTMAVPLVMNMLGMEYDLGSYNDIIGTKNYMILFWLNTFVIFIYNRKVNLRKSKRYYRRGKLKYRRRRYE